MRRTVRHTGQAGWGLWTTHAGTPHPGHSWGSWGSMAAMRRGLLHLLAWLLATGAAATLSWWGVHSVMAGTAYDPPRALPITAVDAKAQGAPAPDPGTARPTPSSTKRPAPEPEPEPDKSDRAEPSPTPSESAPPSAGPSAGTPTYSGRIKSYDTEGGRAVFSLDDTYATLVSATPGSGWSMQVWKTETWIRVEFASGADRVTVFCTWHDSAPRVAVQTY
ncbi:hypothetical protein GCM10017771_42180 [Streptomyces capitiformicae]|uniref:Secreted protein n=2 Tax=Streptomyces capitiformicae TaxID=2014920 RepID=A0A919D8K5_9ACTN|nr:hypothetical protein GCM10017771_42180 [Streptomyces capitiformicae]